MSKFSSYLKLLIIVFALSFATSCNDDEDTVVSPTDNTQKKDDNKDSLYKDIVADEYEVLGQVKICKDNSVKPTIFTGWNLGAREIIVEINHLDTTIQVGQGNIEPTGNFNFTLNNTLSTKFMKSPLDYADELDDGNFNKTEFYPTNLLLSNKPRIYAVLDDERKEIFCKTSEYYTDSCDYSSWIDIEYSWNFFSNIGMTEVLAYTYDGPRYPVKIDNLLGWNIMSYRKKPITVRNVKSLPTEAVYFIEE